MIKGHRAIEFLARFKITYSCWVWIGHRKLGYGYFWDGERTSLAHRVSYLLFKGKPPEGLDICHLCDNKACVNPHHLFAGTHQQNMADASKKGRFKPPDNRGSRNGRSKLNEAAVRNIRKSHAAGQSINSIAEQYSMDRKMIFNIVTRRNWRSVK